VSVISSLIAAVVYNMKTYKFQMSFLIIYQLLNILCGYVVIFQFS
jgi:hypothetical protein